MPLQMFALVRVSDQSKITESRETTHLQNGDEAWVPIVYEDKPEVSENKIAERIEGLDGAKWVKRWAVRNKTDAEKFEDAKQEKEKRLRKLNSDLLGIVYAIATGGDVSAFIAEYERASNNEA